MDFKNFPQLRPWLLEELFIWKYGHLFLLQIAPLGHEFITIANHKFYYRDLIILCRIGFHDVNSERQERNAKNAHEAACHHGLGLFIDCMMLQG